MALTPHKLREIVFHLLYSWDFAPDCLEENFPFLMREHKVTKKSLYAAEAQVKDIQMKLPTIDKMIAETATEYPFERIPHIERNLLRLGIFELYFSPSVPPKVAISEAVRLAVKFASSESGKFINAILDALYKKRVYRDRIDFTNLDSARQSAIEACGPNDDDHSRVGAEGIKAEGSTESEALWGTEEDRLGKVAASPPDSQRGQNLSGHGINAV